MPNIYKTKLDIKSTRASFRPIFVQYDHAKLEIELLDDGTSYDLSNIERVEFTHVRGDGAVIIQAGEIITTGDKSLVIYEYQGTEMDVIGTVKTSFALFDKDNKKVSTHSFEVVISKDLRDTIFEPAQPNFGLLQNLINDVQYIKENGGTGGGTGGGTVIGQKGEPGKDGKDGISSYVWIRYSANSTGNPMSTNSTNARYIGIAMTTTNVAPTTVGAYTWSLFKGDAGERGLQGERGYTPQKGIDYFDGKNGVDGKTPVKGVDYFDGQDGYTPQKGIDYFDGKDGYTPVKNVDYFDGAKGEKGDSFKYSDFTPAQLESLRGPEGQKGDPGSTANIDAHVIDNAPHRYGNKFEWRYNAATNSLDLVVL